jgi:hypothetical protein
MPPTFWPTYFAHQDRLLPFYEAEFAAIVGRDPGPARLACEQRAAVMGQIMLTELIRRRVIPPSPNGDLSF